MSRWSIGMLGGVCAAALAGCVVQTETVPGPSGEKGEPGAQGAPGDSVWQQGDGFIYYGQGDSSGELTRISGEHPTAFLGTQHTVTLGGGVPTSGTTQYISMAFGKSGDSYSVYGGIGVKVETQGSSLVFGTSQDYGQGITNEAMVIERDGNVGIGAPSAGNRLYVNGVARAPVFRVDAGAEMRHDGADGIIFVAGFQSRMSLTNNGSLGIGKAPQYRVDIDGDVNATMLRIDGACVSPSPCPSDVRLKKNVEPLSGSLERLLRLHGVTYEWKEPESSGNRRGPQIGMIAQDVEPVFPEWVGEGKDGYKTLAIRGFEALTVESLRELVREKDRLASEVEQARTDAAVARAEGERTKAALSEVRTSLVAERTEREKLQARLARLEERLNAAADGAHRNLARPAGNDRATRQRQ